MKELVIAAILLATLSSVAFSQATHITPSCPTFYYFNSSSADCQPQTLSPACPPNTNNTQVLYLCTGRAVNQTVCTPGYTFSDNRCLLTGSGGGYGVPNISSGQLSSWFGTFVSIVSNIFSALGTNLSKLLNSQ